MSATVEARYPRSVMEVARPSSRRRRNGSISTGLSMDLAEAASSATVFATSPPSGGSQPDQGLASTWYQRVPYSNRPLVPCSTKSMWGVHSDEHHRHPSGPGAARDQIAPDAADSKGLAGRRILYLAPVDRAADGPPLRRCLHAQRSGLRPNRGGGESALAK